MKSHSVESLSRRVFLGAAPVASVSLLLSPQYMWAMQKKGTAATESKEEEVGPAEDLMREHGVLKRILLIYEEARRRIAAQQDFSPAMITNAAKIIQSFIEDYHEKLEEDHLFPRFRKAGKLVDLVYVLAAQHKAGRIVTERILGLANAQSMKNQDERRRFSDQLAAFIRMYAPHEAREDTVLFPELHKIISHNEYDSLGEQFERIEHQNFGEDGFESMVAKVADIEKQLGIYELAQFTPK